MTLLKDAIQEKLLDVRMIEKNLQKGIISHELTVNNLNELPDDSDDAEYISIEEILADPSLNK